MFSHRLVACGVDGDSGVPRTTVAEEIRYPTYEGRPMYQRAMTISFQELKMQYEMFYGLLLH